MATPPVDEHPPAISNSDPNNAVMEKRPAYFDGGWIDIPHYDRSRLAVGARVEGPAIIRQYDTTTVLLPRHFAEVDSHGNLLIWPVSRGK